MDGTANDQTGSNHPSASNALSFVPGQVGQGVALGPGGFIDIPNSSSLDNPQFTWDAWVRPDGPGPNNDIYGSLIIGQDIDNIHASVSLSWSVADNRFRFAYGDVTVNIVPTQHSFPAGTFYHVAVTYDGTVYTIWVNGIQEGKTGPAPVPVYGTGPWTIGAAASNIRAQNFQRTWNGVIDELEVFNHALSQTEIAAVYAAGSQGECRSSSSCAAPPTGLTAWWPGDGDANDLINKDTGTVVGNLTFVPGIVSKAFSFDGLSSRLDIPATPQLKFSGDFTIEFWANPASTQVIWADILRNSNGESYGIEKDGLLGSNNYYAGWTASDGSNQCWGSSNIFFTLTPGVWQHLAVVKSGMTRTIYINGSLVPSATCTGTNATVSPGASTLQWGGSTIFAGRNWNGTLDEIGLYGRALSAAEIQLIYNAGGAGKCRAPNVLTPISGNLSGNLSINNSPYNATGDVTIPVGSTLTIDPGVVIKMSTGTHIAVNGTLSALGTSANPVILTSLQDSTIGGDTTGNGTLGSPGNWGLLQFTASSSSTLNNTLVRFGQAVAFLGGSIQVNQVTSFGMSQAAFQTSTAALLTGGGLSASGSAINGVQVLGAPQVLTSTVFIPNLGLPYVLTGGEVRVDAGGQLIMGPGVMIKGTNQFSLEVINGGKLISQGTPSSPVIFTDLRDDAVGGDTNNDGAATAPAFGGWGGVQLLRAGPSTQLLNLQLRWGGNGPRLDINGTNLGAGQMPALDIQGSSVTLTGIQISSSILDGLGLSAGAHVSASAALITNNNNGVSTSGGSIISIETSTIQGNRIFGVTNADPSVTADATYDYWGSSTGPRIAGNPGGLGDAVSGHVQFEPYLSSPAGGIIDASDVLPPRTRLIAGTPRAGQNPVTVSSGTPLSLAAVDDRAFIGDGLGAGVQQTQYAVDGSSYSVYAGTFVLTQVGSHTVSYFSQDTAGNVETATSTVVAVADASVPVATLQIGTPFFIDASSRTFISSSTALSLSVGNSSGGIARYALDNGGFIPYAQPFTLSEGTHTVVYQGQNIFGLLESTHSAILVADASPPTVQALFSPQAAFDGTGGILLSTQTSAAFQFQDAFSGLASAQVRLDGGSFQLYQGTFTLAAGPHTLEVKALDHVGNLRSVAPFAVTVGTTALPDTGDPSAGTLPDGTPVVVSPGPFTVSPQSPAVSQITYSPQPPLGRGMLTVTVKFSTLMDNTVTPVVSLTPPAQGPLLVSQASYVADTWTGTLNLTDTVNSGSAVLLVSGARGGSGLLISPAVRTLQINIPLLAPPGSVSASAQNGRLALAWPGVSGAASYNLYRTTAAASSRAGLVPLQTGLGLSALDQPSPDVPALYYAVTSVAQDGTESRLSPATAAAMPLTPAITRPAGDANVDFSSTVVQGAAQPGALIDLSATISTGTLATAAVGSDGFFSAPLRLGHGPFTVIARARSSVTGLVSSSAAISFTVIDFPLAPANFAAGSGDTTVTLTWTQSAQPDVIGYNLYRDNAVTPLNVQPLPVNQTSYQDIALTDGRTYGYVLTSVRTGGQESLPSPAVQGAPAAGPGWGTP